MKKSFMTRALATGLSLAMAFSLTAVSNVSTASAAADPAMNSTTMTVKIGQSKNFKATKATRSAYKIVNLKMSKAGKTKADVSINEGGKSIKVTGKAATKKSNLVITFKNKTTKKKSTVTTKVVVKEETPVVETLSLTAVKQTASNAVNVTFNNDASKDVTKDNLTVKSADGAVQLSVKSLEFSADGKSAKVTVFGNFTDGTQYNVNYNAVDIAFTASVGAVANIVISTTEAQQNVTTPIEFSLFDASGVDVTPAIALDTNVYVSVTGTYASVDVDKASDAKINMTTVGDTAEVTVTYNSNAKDAADITAKQTITCVDAKASQGNKLFAVTEDINSGSGCAKFYLGLSDSAAKIALDDTEDIYFCAKDENGDVIKYDSYDVESSNDNIVNAAVSNADGKFANIKATANTIGSAQLNVTASKNGKLTYYTIPVTTYKADVPVKMTLSIDKPTMSDSDDSDYKATVTAQLLDADGKEVEGDFTAKVVENTATTPIILGSTDENDTDKAEFTVTAHKATARTYTIEVTGADNNDYTTPFTRRVNVVVKALPDTLKNITYNIELSKSALDVSDKDERSTTAKLYATSNGLFAGYVDMADSSHIGGKPVNVNESLKAVTMSAIFGTQTFGAGTLITTGSAVTATGKASISFDAVDSAAVASKQISAKFDVAKLGNYTVKFQFIKNAPDAKTETRTTNLSVKNSYATPTVKVLSTKADSLVVSDIINDCLITNVDMNNDASGHESIWNLLDKDYRNAVTTGTKNDKLIAKYAVVKDNIDDENWLFYVPLNATFTLK